jgi:thioredoxin-related protein
VAAVGELQAEYGTRVSFNVIPAEETKMRTEEVNGFGFEAQLHGLVAFDADGEAIVKIPGHQFGRDEIEAAIQQVL